MPISLRLYHESLKETLKDKHLKGVLERFAINYKANRKEIFSSLDERAMIEELRALRDENLAHNEGLYELFKYEAEKRGVIVHRAATAEECRNIVLQIAQENNCKNIVKSKSLTAEEIHLNEALIEKGLKVTETDLGEWIIQLRHETPSHLVLPAIHLSKEEVAQTFSAESGEKVPQEIPKLVNFARNTMRQKFFEADMAITGANFAIAKSGTIGLCTNEGNTRLCTDIPNVLVTICGLEKLVASIGDALKILALLPRNATAQTITSYVTFLTGAVSDPNAPNGKKNRHVIFLDNGRTKLMEDKEFSSILRCVRCGACANVCPVYQLVGGHQMGHVYIGAMGLVLTYFYHGVEEARHLAYNCLGCSACKEVCITDIDLPELINGVRALIQRDDGTGLFPSFIGQVLTKRHVFYSLLKLARLAQAPFSDGHYIRHLPFIFSEDHGFRAIPSLAKPNLREQLSTLPLQSVEAANVAIFAGCAHEFVYPGHIAAALELMQRKNITACFPLEQGCCGLPASAMGEKKAAIKCAKHNVEAFLESKAEYITTLCPSCAYQLKVKYPEYLAKDPYYGELSKTFASKVLDFASFVKNILKLEKNDFLPNTEQIGYHSPCHECHSLGIVSEPREIIQKAAKYVPSDEEDNCCGFGGSYSVKFPEMSAALVGRKLKALEGLGISSVVTNCPGCVLQLAGGEEKRGRNLRVEHLAEFLLRLMRPKGVEI
ncbi:MAG: LUD domain-containing protein [Deltaproteobacteria bacterium]|jgi:iron-sulfur cluster protein|nr:LUD domain-containing protein [Deltaproteobacteria bacterium]